MRIAPLFTVCVVSSLSRGAVAAPQSTAGTLDVGASLGFSVPLADAERGARVRDTTFGAVPLSFDVAYRVRPSVGVTAQVQYGVGIPTLCQTAGDCIASFGTDVRALLGVRLYAPRVGPMSPELGVGIGYEWFTARFSDSGAHSSRSYDGPVLLWCAVGAPFRIRDRWTLGPVALLAAGTFIGSSLKTNVGSVSGNVAERSIHAWMQLAVRFAHEF
jgi:outer membrane protein